MSNFDVLKGGKVLIVDASPNQVQPGMELESLIRRIDSEGRSGLIIYGPVYRPVFRTKALLQRAEPTPVVAR
jgi:uncharacterized OB-fold protein